MSYKKDVAKVIDAVRSGYEAVTGKPIPTMACLVCKTQTQVTTLGQYGARCFACYERMREGDEQSGHHYASIGDADWHDTPTQRDMRPRIRGTLHVRKPPATPIEKPTVFDDAERLGRAKQQEARRVSAYARDRGIKLERGDD